MNRYQINAFFAQFPFLKAGDKPVVRDIEEVEEVKVSRISPDFLQTRAWYNGATGSLVGIDDSERIFLLDKDGNVLIEVEQGGYCRHNEAHTDDEQWDGETVGEALLRLENPDDVMYAVSVHTGYEVRDHHSVGGNSVTLYKAPKGFTLKGWVEEQKRRAKTEVMAMVAEIDAEG